MPKARQGNLRVAQLSTYEPTHCGIAAFARHTLDSRSDNFAVRMVRDTENRMPQIDGYPGFNSLGTVEIESSSDYSAMVWRICHSGIDAVIVQHEFGIVDNRLLHCFLRQLVEAGVKVVPIFHTIHPDLESEDQSSIVDIATLATTSIVLSEASQATLRGWTENRLRVALMPHPHPKFPRRPSKNRQSDGELSVVAPGFLRPKKGFEWLIEGVHLASAQAPDSMIRASIVGCVQVHRSKRRQFEAYVSVLNDLARGLGSETVEIVNQFIPEQELLHHLQSADIVATLYQDFAQTSSGILSYSLGMGTPVVTTRYPAAVDACRRQAGVTFVDGPSDLAHELVRRSRLPLVDRNIERERVARAAEDYVWVRSRDIVYGALLS